MAGWSVPGVVHVKEVGIDPVGRRVLARHRVTRRPLAITYLAPELLADTDFRARFGAECTRLARVREARVARVHRYVECDGAESDRGAAVVSDHVSGTPLRTLLCAQGALGTAAALAVLKDVLRALVACHGAGLAHGHLKPESLILTSAGRARLIDLGLWTFEGRRLLTRSTPFYLAPEQWSGPGMSQAGAGDVYAATVTFFECLAGAPPFYAEEAAELSAKHARSVPPVEVIPEPVRELVLRGLAKDPSNRPGAEQLLDLAGEVAVRTAGSDWEMLGRRELAAAVANPSALPEISVLSQARGGAGRGYGRPVRLAAVMGGALAVAVGLASPPLAVIPGTSILGSAGMPPVLAFPETDQGTVAVRVQTNGPVVDRPVASATKVGSTGVRPAAPSIPVASIHTAPYEPAGSHPLGQGVTHRDGAAANPSAVVGDNKPSGVVKPQRPAPDSISDPAPVSVPVSLPVKLPAPVELPVPVGRPTPLGAPVLPVQLPRSIVIGDQTEPEKETHLFKHFRAQVDSPRSRKSVRVDRPDFTGGYGHSAG